MAFDTQGSLSVFHSAFDADVAWLESSSFGLLGLPTEILRRVLDHLLLAQQVVIPGFTRAQLPIRYPFQVQVLRTCRRLNVIGRSVLMDNDFILIKFSHVESWGLHQRFDTLLGEAHIHVWKPCSTTTLHRLAINVLITAGVSETLLTTPIQVMICFADFEKYVHFHQLRAYNSAWDAGCTVEVQAAPTGNMLPFKVQAGLLAPFQKLRLPTQTRCEISGHVNADLARLVRTRIVVDSRVLWRLSYYLRYLETMEQEMELAVEMFNSGNLILARRSFHRVLAALHNCTELAYFKQCDEVLYRRYCYCGSKVDDGLHLIYLSLSLEQRRSEGHAQNPHYFPAYLSQSKANQYAYRGMRAWLAGDLQATEQFIALGLEADEFNSVCQLGMQSLAASQASGSMDPWSHAEEWLDGLPKYMTFLSRWDRPHVTACRDQDVYALKKLGYTGDLLEGVVKQKQGYSVDQSGKETATTFEEGDVDLWVARELQKQAEAERAGQTYVICVGADAAEVDRLKQNFNNAFDD